MTFSGRFVLNMIRFVQMQGADATTLMALTDHSPEELCDEETRVSAAVYNAVIEESLRQTEDPALGLHLGESLNLSAAGLIAQISQTSRTIKEALEYCCEFASLGCRALPVTLEERDDHYRVVLTPDPEWARMSAEAVQHTIDGYLAFTIREFHSLTFNKQRPIALELGYPKPAYVSELERVMECPIAFGGEVTALLLKKEHVLAPVVTSDYKLLRVLVGHAHQKLAEIEQEVGFARAVRQSILNLVKPEFPTIEQVAGHLCLSVRSLQRKLKEEGLTYKVLLDELRKDFACDYLKQADLTINEVAYLLNYTDGSAFIRSFKRWMGMTPLAYRQSL